MAKGKNKGSGTPSGAPASPAPAKPAAPAKNKSDLGKLLRYSLIFIAVAFAVHWMRGCGSTKTVTTADGSIVATTQPTTAKEVWQVLGRTEENKPRIIPETHQEADKVIEMTGTEPEVSEEVEAKAKSTSYKGKFKDYFWRMSSGNVNLLFDAGTPRQKTMYIDLDGKHTLIEADGSKREYKDPNNIRIQSGSIQVENLNDYKIQWKLIKK